MERPGYKLVLLGTLAVLFVLSGCDDTLTSFNENPNQPINADPNNLLANGQRDIHYNLYDDAMLTSDASLYAQYTTQNFYPDQYASIDYDWSDVYSALNDLEEAKAVSREGDVSNAANLEAVAIITQVWTFQILTDAYGSIPFTEALKESENPSPAYTPQSEIYPALVDSLDKALSIMNPGGEIPSGDLVYSGDMSAYEKLANGLKLRIAIRMSDRDSEMAETIISDVVDTGTTLQSNEENAYFQFGTSATHRNTFYENRFVLGRDDYDMSERFIEAMQQYDAADDPRLDAYAEQTSNSSPPCEDGSREYAGFPFELEQAAAQGIQGSRPTCVASRPEAWWLAGPSGNGDAYSPIMYYDEVLFIKAEAAEKGYISGAPEDYLAQAIEASIDFYGEETEADISSSDAQTQAYVDAVVDEYSSASGEEWRDILGEQKWIAFYLQNIQGWITWRRLDFDEWIGPPAGGVAGGELGGGYAPVRVTYPESEFNLNLANVEEAANDQFGGVSSENAGQRIWWDVNSPPPEGDAYQP